MHDRRWWILVVLVLCMLMVGIDNTILNVALPSIERSLAASQGQLEWIFDTYILAFAGLLFTAGVVADRYGRRRLLILGLALFGVGSLASAFATSADQLIATRALMGVGGATILPSSLSIITNTFAPAERGRAIGIWAGVAGLAIALGPLAGGALLVHFWWGSVFLVNLPIVALGLAAAGWLIPESRDPGGRRVDIAGIGLLVAGLVALVYGIVRAGALASLRPAQAWGPILAAAVLLGLFVWVERGSKYPVLDVTLFRDSSFSAASAAVTAAFFALFGVAFFLTFYLQFVRGYSPLAAGLRLMPVALAQILLAPRGAGMVARFGAKIVCTAGLLLIALGFLLYGVLQVNSPIWLVEVLLFLIGAGIGTVVAPATELLSVRPPARAGAGTAVNNTTRQVGGALGVAIIGSVLSGVYRGRVESLLGVLPESSRQQAGESIGATLLTARQVGDPALTIVEPAKQAFVYAVHVACLGSAAVSLLAALVAAIWLPGRARRNGPLPAGLEPLAESAPVG